MCGGCVEFVDSLGMTSCLKDFTRKTSVSCSVSRLQEGALHYSKTIAEFTDDIFLAINNSMCTIATFVDFRKAFDNVSHLILLTKCDRFGIRGNVLNWLESYLSERKQRTVANGCTSKDKQIVCGVPQVHKDLFLGLYYSYCL